MHLGGQAMSSRHIALAVLIVAPFLAQSSDRPTAEKLPEEATIRLGTGHFVHSGRITALAFSPDSSLAATGTEDGFVHLWHVESGREQARWRHDPHNEVHAIQFSPDGKRIAVADFDGMVRVSDLVGGQVFSHSSRNADPPELAWLSADRLAIAHRKTGTVAVCDVSLGRKQSIWPTGLSDLKCVASSSNGERLYVSDAGGRIKCFSAAKGHKEVALEQLSNGPAYYRKHGLLAVSVDGKTLIADGPGTGVSMWDTATGKIKRQIRDLGKFSVLAASPNGRFVAVHSANGTIQVRGLASGAEIRSLPARAFPENIMAFSPDGRRLAETTCNRRLRIWDLATDKELHANSGHGLPIYAVVFIAGGRIVTAAEDQTLRCWDIKSGKEIDRLSTRTFFQPLVASPGSDGVLLHHDYRSVMNWRPGRELGLPLGPSVGGVVMFAADGRNMAVQSEKKLSVIEIPSGKEIAQIPRMNNGYPSAVAPGARWAAFTEKGDFRTIQIYDLVQKRHRQPVTADSAVILNGHCIHFSPDGRLLIAANNRETYVWEAFSSLQRATIPRPAPDGSTRFPSGVIAAAFSPDGRLIALEANGAVYLHDLPSGQTAGPFVGHRGAIFSLAFSADGSLLASAGQDATAVVWDVAKLRAKLPKATVSPATRDQLEAWWNGLASVDGKVVNQAVWSLVDRPVEALALLRAKLKPVLKSDAAEVERLITELNDAQYAVREKASRRLAALGEGARPALTVGLKSVTAPEARTRIARLLKVIDGQYAPARLQPLRALEVLEKIGGPKAREQLESLARRSTDEEIRDELQRVLIRWR